MFKSAKRDKAEGTVDRIAGRVLEFFGRLTGRTSTKGKGKAARARGGARTARGKTKRAAK